MSDTISLEFIGLQLRTIQAEQRNLRMENELIRREMGHLVTRQVLQEVLTVLVDRIANFEALLDARLDGLSAQIAALAAKP